MTHAFRTAIVSGSGLDLNGLLDSVRCERPFAAYPSLPSVSVAGHAGVFTEGMCGALPVIVQRGRCHFYEGLNHGKVTASIRLLASLGVKQILFLNAAGGLKAELEPGSLLAVNHIETWPYARWPGQPGQIIPHWRVPGCDGTGVYVWVHGPSYETRAEIAALVKSGASAVGMSTAPELAAACALGLRTAAVSCITNNCLCAETLRHDDVVATARRASAKLCAVLRRALPQFAGNG